MSLLTMSAEDRAIYWRTRALQAEGKLQRLEAQRRGARRERAHATSVRRRDLVRLTRAQERLLRLAVESGHAAYSRQQERTVATLLEYGLVRAGLWKGGQVVTPTWGGRAWVEANRAVGRP